LDTQAAEKTTELWPLAVYAGLVVATAAGLVVVSYLLGERHGGRATGQPYESGLEPTGTARPPVTVNFYLVAALFVIFDVEAVFIIVWAGAFRRAGWAGYVEIVVFTAVLGAALFYLWRAGALRVIGGRGQREKP
jgi:NADH-quinone oxidoreductase subunit A